MDNFKSEREEEKGTKSTKVRNHVVNIEQEYETGTALLSKGGDDDDDENDTKCE